MQAKCSLIFSGAAIFIVGLLLLYSLIIQNLGLVLFGASTTGVIERIESTEGAAERPLVRFTSESGRQIRFRGFNIARGSYQANQEVQLRYFPSNPHNAEIDSWLSLWRPLGIGLFVTSCLLLGGLFLLRKGLKLPPKDKKPCLAQQRGKSAYGLYVIGGLWLAMTITGISFVFLQEDGTKYIDQALVDSRKLFATLPLPAGAEPYTTMKEDVYSGQPLTSVTIQQIFTVSGKFPEVVKLYEKMLPQQGWVAWNKDDWEHHAIYRNPPWEVKISRDAYYYENPSRPHHHFTLTLTWRFK